MTKGFSGLEKEIKSLQELYQNKCRQLELHRAEAELSESKLIRVVEALRQALGAIGWAQTEINNVGTPTGSTLHGLELRQLRRREMELLLEDE